MTLFARHQTGYFLTDAGREVLRHAEAVEESIMALERSATGLDKTPAGTVRLATSESLATNSIIPAMPAFRARYPRICFEIVTSTVAAELGRHEADVALRVEFLAAEEDFVQVVPADQMFSNEVWLVTHADLIASARIRAVGDFLADQVNANPDLAR